MAPTLRHSDGRQIGVAVIGKALAPAVGIGVVRSLRCQQAVQRIVGKRLAGPGLRLLVIEETVPLVFPLGQWKL